jgi:hypothetical protein
MRTFWAIIAMLVLAGVLVFALSRAEKSAPRTQSPTAPSTPSPAPAPTNPSPAAQLDEQLGIVPAPTPNQATNPAPKHAGHVAQSTVQAPAPRKAPAPPDTSATPLPPGAVHAPAAIGEFAVAPGAFARRADGSLLADARFPIRGKGTKSEPYVVSWELLVSAEEAFEPAKKRLHVPQRVAMLHDTIVTLEGYVAFPLMIPQPQELLLMMNQWDGCCIGIPPTPYDAVEVRLVQPAKGDDRLAFSGSATGLFKVEPFVVKNPAGDWLMSMYTISDATFAPAGAPPPANAGGEGEPGV